MYIYLHNRCRNLVEIRSMNFRSERTFTIEVVSTWSPKIRMLFPIKWELANFEVTSFTPRYIWLQPSPANTWLCWATWFQLEIVIESSRFLVVEGENGLVCGRLEFDVENESNFGWSANLFSTLNRRRKKVEICRGQAHFFSEFDSNTQNGRRKRVEFRWKLSRSYCGAGWEIDVRNYTNIGTFRYRSVIHIVWTVTLVYGDMYDLYHALATERWIFLEIAPTIPILLEILSGITSSTTYNIGIKTVSYTHLTLPTIYSV